MKQKAVEEKTTPIVTKLNLTDYPTTIKNCSYHNLSDDYSNCPYCEITVPAWVYAKYKEFLTQYPNKKIGAIEVLKGMYDSIQEWPINAKMTREDILKKIEELIMKITNSNKYEE